MFVKSTISRGHEYVQIVKSVRKEGKPRHEVIANLGRADILAESGRDNIITALKKYVNTYKRFIKTGETEQEEQNVMLDDAKIEQAARFDGFAALQCRCLGIDALEAIRQYRQLWRIEESFRIITSTMKTRPIFLRTQKHIEGHFVMCFLGFL